VTGTGSSAQTHVYLWNASVPYVAGRIQIPVWQYNSKHNGIYGMTDLVSVGNEKTETPSKYALHQNYPNPFNPATRISFSIPKQEFVTLKVYNSLGKEIETLVNKKLNAGNYDINFNAGSLPSGVYFYRLITESYSETKKMIILK
jgi:hypothetical protein